MTKHVQLISIATVIGGFFYDVVLQEPKLFWASCTTFFFHYIYIVRHFKTVWGNFISNKWGCSLLFSIVDCLLLSYLHHEESALELEAAAVWYYFKDAEYLEWFGRIY